ncbi:hypothetical protein BDZ88DRAFT_451819 [Geranomyces variabilis]|nr:hypothetical protein BDZ88DRAFT_451819 [Geranomyces variabilis]
MNRIHRNFQTASTGGSITNGGFTDGRTDTNGWNIGQTDANGGSTSHSLGTTSTRGITDSNGRESHIGNGRRGTAGPEHCTDETVTISRSDQVSQEFPAGTYLYSACQPQVRSTVIPWGCRGAGPDEIKILTSKVQQLQMSNGKPYATTPSCRATAPRARSSCLTTISALGPPSTEPTSCASTGTSTFPKPPWSPFAILDADTVIWQTGLRNFGGPSAKDDPSATMDTRVRITSDGHVVQEARNILIKNRNLGEWINVWSSVPRNLNYTVDVYGEVGYAMVLQDDGKLVLRDGVGAKIWSSARSECTNAWGYKHPQELRFPLSYSEPEPYFPGQTDPHNELPARIQ